MHAPVAAVQVVPQLASLSHPDTCGPKLHDSVRLNDVGQRGTEPASVDIAPQDGHVQFAQVAGQGGCTEIKLQEVGGRDHRTGTLY